MKALRSLLLAAVLVGLLGATAYGAGYALRAYGPSADDAGAPAVAAEPS